MYFLLFSQLKLKVKFGGLFSLLLSPQNNNLIVVRYLASFFLCMGGYTY